jgi:hypothetical protein
MHLAHDSEFGAVQYQAIQDASHLCEDDGGKETLSRDAHWFPVKASDAYAFFWVVIKRVVAAAGNVFPLVESPIALEAG